MRNSKAEPTLIPGQEGRVIGRDLKALWRLFDRAVAAWRWRRQRAAAIRALRAWDDQALKDIGLTRGEIRAAVDGELQRGRGRPARRPDRRGT